MLKHSCGVKPLRQNFSLSSARQTSASPTFDRTLSRRGLRASVRAVTLREARLAFTGAGLLLLLGGGTAIASVQQYVFGLDATRSYTVTQGSTQVATGVVPDRSGTIQFTSAAASPISIQASGANAGDQTPPAAVTDLAAGSAGSTSLVLTWTAPGDDGGSGAASTYDLRYSNAAITGSNFAAATPVANLPAPASAGASQNTTVSGLQPGMTYYFALKTADEAPNWSSLSNVPSAATLPASDVTPPAGVTTLTSGAPTATTVFLAWKAPGDDGFSGHAARYDLRYSASIITSANFGSATQVSGVPAPAEAAGTMQTMIVGGLQAGTRYYFALKAADEVPNWSNLSNLTLIATTTVDDAAPAAVTNLGVISTNASAVALSWTAPGDDGGFGTAAEYDLRYSTSSITSANFASATPVAGIPAPAPAGTSQTMVVSGLDSGVTYYFALETADEAPNWSPISNTPSATTSPNTDSSAPSTVGDLAAESATSSSILVKWTAPGDDAMNGTAATYDLRYSTAPINESTFASANRVEAEPSPASAWSRQDMIVGGLLSSTRYYFALKTADDAGHWSGISNIPTLRTHWQSPWPAPYPVSNLSATAAAAGVRLTWTNPVNSRPISPVLFDVRYATEPLGQSNWDSASQAMSEPTPHGGGANETFTLPSALLPNTTYYFGIKVAYADGNWTALSNIAQVFTQPGRSAEPYGPVADLSIADSKESTLTVAWKAFAGQADVSSYDVRYSSSPITALSWDGCPRIAIPMPTGPSATQALTIAGLTPGTRYYVAVRVGYVSGAWSEISNVASASTAPVADTWAPAAIGDLRVISQSNTSVTLAWTSVGDDGILGKAAMIDVCSSSDPITEDNRWNASHPAVENAPRMAGTPDTLTIDHLEPMQTYYFAASAWDEAGNFGPISNVTPALTLAPEETTQKPQNSLAAVSDLAAEAVSESAVKLTWTSPAPTGVAAYATAYEVRRSLSTIDESNWELATKVDAGMIPRKAGDPETLLVEGLETGTEHHFAVRAVDVAGHPSPVSPEASARTPVAPAFVGPFPNPSRGEFGFKVSLEREGRVMAALYDVTGRLCAMLQDGVMPKGTHSFSWNASHVADKRLAAGVYLLKVRTPGQDWARKLILRP